MCPGCGPSSEVIEKKGVGGKGSSFRHFGMSLAGIEEPRESPRFGSEWRWPLKCEHHVSEALRLSTELLSLVNEQRSQCEHDACMLLDGIVRDCAWKIRQAALQWRLDQDKDDTAGGGL